MLTKYAATVKNLRGVLLFFEQEDAASSIEWLMKHFRYRNLGIPPSFGEKIEIKKPFVELIYPSGELKKLVELLTNMRIERNAAEAVVLASAYISPIFALDEKSVRFLRPLEAGSVRTSKKLTNRDMKLHLRIADYTVLDFYSWSVENAERFWTCHEVEKLLNERKKKIEKDAKRYWRISGEGKKFLMYLDSLQFICERKGLEKLRKLDPSWASAGLAIGAAICTPKEFIHQ
ncbi:MAG: hypothetical protein QXI28_02160 [Candidatus Hadarchaeales archaeon]